MRILFFSTADREVFQKVSLMDFPVRSYYPVTLFSVRLRLNGSAENAHRAELRSINLPDFQKELLVVFRLVIGIGPWEELVRVVLEMHCDFAEDSSTKVDSVIEIFCRSENHFGLLDIAGIQVHRAFHAWTCSLRQRQLVFQLVGLPLDFRQSIRFNKPLEGKEHAIDEAAH